MSVRVFAYVCVLLDFFVWKMYDMHVTTESVVRYFLHLRVCDWTEPQQQACGVSVCLIVECLWAEAQ